MGHWHGSPPVGSMGKAPVEVLGIDEVPNKPCSPWKLTNFC